MSENGNLSLNLYQKLARISGDLGAITKDAQAPGEMGGFRFMSHGALMGHLREKLAEQQVAILESLEIISDDVVMMKTKDGERPNRRVVVRLTAEFVNGENPEDRCTVVWYGEGLDTRDKALQKAGTSAEKYLLSKTFKVSDKDDPDGQEADEMAPQHKARSQPKPRQQSNGKAHQEPKDIHPDVPTPEQLEELYRLAASLPGENARNHIYVDDRVKRVGHQKVYEGVLEAHERLCGGDCEHLGGAGDGAGQVAPPAPADPVSPTQERLV